MKHLVFFCFLLVFVFSYGCSDENTTTPQDPPQVIEYATLYGGVIDSVGGKPLDSARITTQPATKTFYSNEFGSFQIDSMVVGTEYHVFVEKAGYSNSDNIITINNSYNSMTAVLYPENSNWTYLTSMDMFMNNRIEVLNNANILTTTSIVNYAMNTYVQVAGSNYWAPILSDEETQGYYRNPYNNYVYAYTGDNVSPNRTPDLYLSVDNGINWSQKFGGSIFGMAFFQSGTSYAAIYHRPSTFELKKSTDHGQNWFYIDPIPGYQYFNIKKVLNERIILQTSDSPSNDSVYYSDNEGTTWQVKVLVSGNYANYIKSSLVLNNSTLICRDFYNPNFSIVKSNDNGDNWSPISSNFPITSRDSVNIYVANNNYIYAIKKSEERGIYVSTDNGSNYFKIGTGLPGSKFPVSLSFDGQGYAYIVIGQFYVGSQYIKRIYKSNTPYLH